MRAHRLLVLLATALVVTGCQGPAGPKPLQPTVPAVSFDPGPHACTYVVELVARTALGRETRRTASRMADVNTFCTYRTDQVDSDLIVVGGAGGPAAFNTQLANAEQDMGSKRVAVGGVAEGYVVSGTQLGAVVVLVGAIRGANWFTATLRIKDASRSTVEERAVVVLKAGVGRLET